MSFSKVLIANRGEIAVRLVRACQSLDLQAVAVYSDADAQALHVALADEAVHIGPAEARASYLDGAGLIAAAQRCGAQAIHPGYGFLAENAEFAQACADAGLVFVGPSPRVIAAMGAKIEAKRIAEAAGVACVPGYHGDDQSADRLASEAARIGTPLLIKASAGGGGRGMRRVDDLGEFQTALRLAQEEARAAFGDAAVLLERYVEAPRHIEVQILADQHGQVRHLYERDCSVQRHYQKVIEEAPAPNLSPVLREQMLSAAVTLARTIGYDSAGTVEFVVDAVRGEAYFLEMNTRLQVEHPVTEAITGLDLAAWQLRVAAGEKLSFAQEQVRCEGWAMEARIAAEDPAAGYQPQTGQITHYVEPQLAGLRIDSGIQTGSVVSPYYDSMLAKLIATAPDRAATVRKLRRGLEQLRIGGVPVNRAFLHEVLTLPAFVSGEHSTRLLDETWPQGWSAPQAGDLDCAHAVLARHLEHEAPRSTSAWGSLGAWRLGEASGRAARATYHLQLGEGDEFELTVVGRGGDYRLERDGDTLLSVNQARLDTAGVSYVCAGQQRQVALSRSGDTLSVYAGAAVVAIRVRSAEQCLLGGAAAGSSQGNAIVAPTPGQVAEVLVAVGDEVDAGQPIVVLEAMKMLQQLCASEAGVVAAVSVAVGDAVNSGDALVRFAEPS